jgi:hypothetical protein
VDYSDASATRQRVEVKTESSMASMTHFVFPHPDGLATYRVYEKVASDVSGDVEEFHGEAFDIQVSNLPSTTFVATTSPPQFVVTDSLLFLDPDREDQHTIS